MLMTLLTLLPLLARLLPGLPLGRDSVAADGKVAGVDEVLEGGEALDEVALEGVVRQQAQRSQAVDAPRSLKKVEERKEESSKLKSELTSAQFPGQVLQNQPNQLRFQ